ncbi:NodT family efflux transporter outer membrane factor (OMF) lipoprotein [Roseateles depolymerans]|uniref:NodT family efflux transporter, outer membrane factor (OMF) lipoprotein n=1 Tax=Roseateles depolymerans TaxID=76731 RepID=A0A0U3MWF1_9BURK|nr:efflux transporter outer membrane subunit [Roseateles depolymerans]ALV07347.1 NodT family efflux transporter, outer membrane factor (OMF) lipoprotein [Roseateles depolymerans]REG22443.1 NodT family efflux transporter outer membrane factor (OMF) lipoprotein [Roseateles depolymerans]
MRVRLACAGLALILQACATPAPAPAPSVQLPAAWQVEGGRLAVASQWWRGFHDPTLDALVDEALKNNFDLRLATARLQEARAMTAAQRGSELPQVVLTDGANRSRQVSSVSLHPYLSHNNEVDVRASYEVDLWGRVHDLTAAAERSEDAMRQARDAVALSVAASVASGYVTLRALDAQLDLARRTAESRERSWTLNSQRQRMGYASALETAQSEAEWRATTQSIPQLELARKRQEQVLRVMLGRTEGSIERGLPLLEVSLQPLPDIGIPSELLRRRPDIAQAESQVAAADAQWAAARARLLPSLNLAASYGQVSSSILRQGPFSIWSVGGSILAPLFNGGQLRALASASSARRDEALLTYQKVVLTSLSEVETQLTVLSKSQEQLAQAELQGAALERSYKIASRRYAEGYASYLDQLLAERSLFAVQQSILQLHAETLVAEISVYRALGGGWSQDAAPSGPESTRRASP